MLCPIVIIWNSHFELRSISIHPESIHTFKKKEEKKQRKSLSPQVMGLQLYGFLV